MKITKCTAGVRALSGAVFVALFVSTLLFLPAWCGAILFAICAAEIMLIEWPRLCAQPGMRWAWRLAPIYPVLPLIVLMVLSFGTQRSVVLYIFVLACVHDTSAYLVGSLMGKHLLWPTISPKKTWEGVVGGFCGVLIVLKTLLFAWGCALSWCMIIGISVVASIAFVTGDLFESWIKRKAGLKDMGNILPGHGGLLDRFDSMLFAAYAAVIWLILFC